MQAINALVSFAVITALFAAMYKYVPDVRLQWRDVWMGAVVTSDALPVTQEARAEQGLLPSVDQPV